VELEHSLAVAKGLADRSRLLILKALTQGSLCVEELANALDLVPSTVSFHLKKLVSAGLVTTRREQYYAVFSLSPELMGMRIEELLDARGTEAATQQARVEQEQRRVIATFFPGGRLTRMPAQRRKRSLVLQRFLAEFDPGVTYTEQEVTARITPLYDDYCLVRRLLVDEGHLVRESGIYRMGDNVADPPASVFARRPRDQEQAVDQTHKSLKQEYKLQPTAAGIFRIQNTVTGKTFLGSTLNLHGPLNRLEFELKHGVHKNRALQDDFARYGRDGFRFEVVEVIEPADSPGFDVEAALEELECRYEAEIDRSNTYNEKESIRFLPKRRGRSPVGPA
jgi:DNA-binding transcriptional ArsR family regulator